MNITALVSVSAGGAIISTDEAMRHARLADDTAEDPYVTALATAVTAFLDGAAGYLRRALLSQTWKLVLPEFPCDGIIAMPLPPLISVQSVKYLDATGTEQTVSASDYRVVLNGSADSLIVPAVNAFWPSALCAPDAVRVAFTAGYGAAASAVPAPIRLAAQMMLTFLYENRSAGMDGALSGSGARALLAPYRVLRL